MHRTSLRSLFFLLLLVSPSLRGSEVPLTYTRVDLTDGRKLQNVVIKTYDARADRVLIVADGKAMSLPRAIFPPPLNDQLKGIRPSGEFVSITTRPAEPRAFPSAAQQYEMARPVTVTRPAPPVVMIPTPAPVPAKTANRAAAESQGISLNAHRTAALKRAERFYRHEFRIGSDSALMMGLVIELDTPQVVPGWEGRCRAEGTASFQLYDSRGSSFQRRTSRFEVVTEKKSSEDDFRIVEFTPKS